MDVQVYRTKNVTLAAEPVQTFTSLPSGVKRWPDERGIQPKDMSVGYMDTYDGRRHVWYGDYILNGPYGRYPMRKEVFESFFELE